MQATQKESLVKGRQPTPDLLRKQVEEKWTLRKPPPPFISDTARPQMNPVHAPPPCLRWSTSGPQHIEQSGVWL